MIRNERPEAFHDRLREGEMPVIGRLEDDEVLLDLRSVSPPQDAVLERAVATAYNGIMSRQDDGR